MFRKTWKTIRFFLIILVIIVCLPHSLLPKKDADKTSLKSPEEQNIRKAGPAIQDTITKLTD